MHYRKHIFCCVNEREETHPRSCCSTRGSIALRNYMKAQARKLGLNDVRVNMAGCLERCELGPVMVVYPEGTWYRYESQSDIDEILQKHIIENQQVKRLQVADGQEFLPWNMPSRQKMRVKESVRLSSSVLKVVLRNVDQAALTEFSPGDHIDLLLSDKAIKVSCWLFGDSKNQMQYVIGVPIDQTDSERAKTIISYLQVGAEIVTTQPKTCALLNGPARRACLIANGAGIVSLLPAYCKFKHFGVDVRLINAYVPSSEDSPNSERLLKQLKASSARIDPGAATLDAADLLDCKIDSYEDLESIAELLGKELRQMSNETKEDQILCIAGPMRFIEACRKDRRFARFASCFRFAEIPTNAYALDHGRSVFDVVLSRHRARLNVSERQTIIDAMNAGGYPIDYECVDGNCGNCRAKVLHGDVSDSPHLSEALTEASRMATLCRSRADLGTRCLILDL